MTEPVTLAEARAQVNIIDDTDTTFDTFLTSLIAPARAYVERVTRYLFVGGSRTETFTSWGDYLEIWRRPIASIDGVTYSTTADPADDADLTDFVVNFGFPARIGPPIGASFPDLVAGGTITVTYTGSAVADTSEEYLLGKRLMLLLIGEWFNDREAYSTERVSPDFDFAVRSMINTLAPVSAY